MRLHSLELHGFKSFADKTTFEFHPGVTAIVGPNGCGKSNVVDAIRWVLGETSARALRGGEMADVIFSGTDQRQPLGIGEVTLTLSDCEHELGTDFNEIAITRRVFRDGKSEYRINNQLCRKRDIHELLMDTGMGQVSYSIMEQGKIDLLLSSKPEDRRAVFEEAAGITKFKTQKKEALRKLDYTEANLVRIADIIAEVVRQKNSMQRQASKAKRYQILLEDVKTLDTHFSHRKFIELRAERGELQTSVGSLRLRQTELQDSIGAAETRISEARTRFQALEEQIHDSRQKAAEIQNRIHTAQNRISFNGERAAELDSLINQNESDIESTREKLDDHRREITSAEETLQRVSDSITRQHSQFEEHSLKTGRIRSARAELDAALQQLRRLSTEEQSAIVSVKAQLSTNLSRIESDGQRRDQLDRELAKLESGHNARIQEKGNLTTKQGEVRELIEEHTELVKSCEREHQIAGNDLVDLRRQLASLQGELAEKTSRLDVLRQMIAKGEGLEKGTQEVLNGLDQPELFKPGVRGVLTSFLKVDEAFIPAIEAALGSNLQTILVTDSPLAESIIDTLTRAKSGEATLLPQDLSPPIEDSQMMTLPDGATAWALDKVKAKPLCQALVEKLLCNVLIVPDLETALALRPGLGEIITYATLQGELVTAEGIIRGGASGEPGAGSILQRQNQVRDLELAVVETGQRRDTLITNITEAENRIAELAANLEEARARLQENRVEQSTLEGQLSVVDREIQQMASKLEGVEWEQGELFKRVESAESEIVTLKEKQTETQQSLENRLTEIRRREAELAETTRQEAESTELLQDLRTALAVERRAEEALRQQTEPMAHRLVELQEMIARRDADIQAYREKIDSAGGESDRLRSEIAGSESQGAEVVEELEKLNGERERQEADLRGTESKLLDNRRELNRLADQRGNEEIKATQLELRIENLASAVRERYAVELEVFEPDAHVLLAAIEDQKKIHARSRKRRASLAARTLADGESPPSEEDTPDPEGETPGDPDTTEIAEDLESPSATEAQEADHTDDTGNGEEDDEAAESANEFPPDALNPDAGPDWDFVESIVGELKRKLDSMGPVNLDAIEEFNELSERHDFLESQHNDLVTSKAELLKVIDQINKTTRVLFKDTFDKVRKNFKGTFCELFGSKAHADLVLVDDDDPLESGIEIIARPPGKKPTSISLLSGGERSMTAVALLFSIYMVKPSPFCVLDELDAPLDESNISRFLKMLDRFIDQSQFIIVTHNKRTMNKADVMYGVTMEEFGVSKPVGMQLTSTRGDREQKTGAERETANT